MQKIYLGPSMSINGILFTQGTIYSNGLPEQINKLAEQNPSLKAMFVDVDKVGQARIDIALGGKSFLGAAYQKVKSEYEKGGK